MIPIYKPRVYTESAKIALDSGWISSQGDYIEKARNALSLFFSVPYVVLMNNGTSATHMLIKALQFKHPEVKTIYVPNNVFVAVWNVVQYEPGRYTMKVLEMDAHTLNMKVDEETIRGLEPNSAVLVVHNIGNIVNVPRLKRLRPDIVFLEDNCEGLFGRYEGQYAGTSTSSLCSAVSFFANKTITSGEGGAFFTHDEDLYNHIYSTIHQGISCKRYVYSRLGYNYRMTNIQAALLYDQMLHVDEILENKERVFKTYEKLLDERFVIPRGEEHTDHSRWMFVVGVPSIEYDALESKMCEHGVDTRPFFFDIRAHAHLQGVDASILNTRNITYFMVPSYPELTEENIHHVVSTLARLIDHVQL